MTLHALKRFRQSKAYPILLIAGALLLSTLILCVAWYICRGVLREHVIPGYYFRRHGSTIQRTLDADTQKANAAFLPSGLQFTQSMPVRCNLDIASNIRTSIWCGGESRGHVEYTKSHHAITDDIARAEALLKKQGWRGGVDRVWGNDPTSPVAYSYGKKYDHLECGIQLYQNMHGRLEGSILCSTAYTFMGDPYEHL